MSIEYREGDTIKMSNDGTLIIRNGDWHKVAPRVLSEYWVEEFWWRPRRPYDEIEKPSLRTRDYTRLGDAVDKVEPLPDWRWERGQTIIEYVNAIRDRTWFELAKLDRVKKAPTHRDGIRLRAERVSAWCRFEEAKASGTLREVIDARAALTFAEERFKIAQRKYHKARRDYKPPSDTFTLNGMTIRRKPRK